MHDLSSASLDVSIHVHQCRQRCLIIDFRQLSHCTHMYRRIHLGLMAWFYILMAPIRFNSSSRLALILPYSWVHVQYSVYYYPEMQVMLCCIDSLLWQCARGGALKYQVEITARFTKNWSILTASSCSGDMTNTSLPFVERSFNSTIIRLSISRGG